MNESFRSVFINDSRPSSVTVNHSLNYEDLTLAECQACPTTHCEMGYDRRQKVDMEGYYGADSYYDVGQLTFVTHTGQKSYGTGTYHEWKGLRFILTCAHNVCSVTTITSAIYYSDIIFYRSRVGQNQWKGKYPITEVYVHPNYKGDFPCGQDIAILICGDNLGDSTESVQWTTPDTDVLNMAFYDTTINWIRKQDVLEEAKDKEIEVNGYPGDDKIGYQYSHTGRIHQVYQTLTGGYCILHDVDTTKGNQGSPIYLTDLTMEGTYKHIIGVHTGQQKWYGLNVATLITKEIADWQYQMLKDHLNCN